MTDRVFLLRISCFPIMIILIFGRLIFWALWKCDNQIGWGKMPDAASKITRFGLLAPSCMLSGSLILIAVSCLITLKSEVLHIIKFSSGSMCAYHESDLDKSLLCISACVLKAINVRNVSSGFIEVGISDFLSRGIWIKREDHLKFIDQINSKKDALYFWNHCAFIKIGLTSFTFNRLLERFSKYLSVKWAKSRVVCRNMRIVRELLRMTYLQRWYHSVSA